MLGGAIAVLLFQQISFMEAVSAINADVMLFLFGVFIVGEGLSRSGSLLPFSYRLFARAMSVDVFILLLILVVGLLSALLMNDTIAIIGTPFVLHISRKYHISPIMLLLVLAFAVTTGSVLSPIGNPQNLLIALEGGLENPFFTFARYLAIPSLVSLILIYPVMKVLYPDEFSKCILSHDPEGICDERLALLSRFSLGIMITLILVKLSFTLLNLPLTIPLSLIALLAALPIILLSRDRLSILKGIDWTTLVFFAALFVLMQSVWNSGVFQAMIAGSTMAFPSNLTIFASGILVSQFISNVPFVALMLPVLLESGVSTDGMMALAAGSTLAGNLLIFGAASNVIIIQNAEKKGETMGFLEFAKAGIPLTIIQGIIFILFFVLFL